MSEWKLNTPVAMLIFKRPQTTEKVFEAVRQAKPPKLLVVSNTLSKTPDEPLEEKCAATRAIIERVDWDCEVLKNYADTYMGCKQRIYSGLDWVFQQVDRAIVLEDDCIPHPTFWRFCDELLDRYQDDDRIAAITGDNFQLGRRRTPDSYYFSRYTHFWGWATWRRAWKNYDVNMSRWTELRDQGWLEQYLGEPEAAEWWKDTFQRTYDEKVDTWDWQWILSCWVNNGLTIVPNVNLVSNIGFNAGATHTGDASDWRANMETQAIQFPLKHPTTVTRHAEADRFEQHEYYNFLTNQRKLEYRLKRRFRVAKRALQDQLKSVFATH
ncbi:glycosyltransferase family 2 protein [Oscillatoria sp. FACHB-1407]|uniref:glycosyltransferase family 2 protein n=1 Tax=Oscillatoria sp. FACHB-1407 TaxID=2692847 RepID=UPI001686128C|nr:glycosyltransferase family 2 protein [Oscillatoria sp. FACHB-1407]MBD2459978.1 glycosyltransferase family 2 protein [Oscillatoria sp. FACHB-1407]